MAKTALNTNVFVIVIAKHITTDASRAGHPKSVLG
jgi:hypothetical protein